MKSLFSLSLVVVACAMLSLALVTRDQLRVAPPTPLVLHRLPEAQARVLPKPVTPQRTHATPDAPTITATSAILVDRSTGAVLFAKDTEQSLPIASITKLMTALVFLDEQPDWNEIVTIESEDVRSGSAPYFVPGDRVAVDDLFFSALVGSINTAVAALARATSLPPEEFVARMNLRAEMLGLTSTHFVEPTGLDPGNVSTPADVVRLARAAFADTTIRAALNVPAHDINRVPSNRLRHIISTNDLVRNPPDAYAITGAKTGFTGDAGYTFTVEAERDGNGVILALLHATSEESRFADADALIRWAFTAHTWPSPEQE